jgi:hypothetical protein
LSISPPSLAKSSGSSADSFHSCDISISCLVPNCSQLLPNAVSSREVSSGVNCSAGQHRHRRETEHEDCTAASVGQRARAQTCIFPVVSNNTLSGRQIPSW